MSLSVQTNIAAFDAHRNLVKTSGMLASSMEKLSSEISSIGTDTQFNGIALLTGNASITFQVGANDAQTITTNAVKLFGSGSSYAVDSSIFTFSGSTINLSAIDAAIQNVSTDRA